MQVAPNTTEDSALLVAALPELKQRTDLDTLYTDGGYGGPESDTALRDQQVTLIQTAIKGRKPNTDKLHLADFAITQDAQGLPLASPVRRARPCPSRRAQAAALCRRVRQRHL